MPNEQATFSCFNRGYLGPPDTCDQQLLNSIADNPDSVTETVRAGRSTSRAAHRLVPSECQ